MDVWAIIPARGGSKGVPRKNIRLLGGIPLIGHTLRVARASGAFGRVLVSTDDPEIAEVARRFDGEVPFLRPAELGGDWADINDAILHMLDRIEETEKRRPEAWAVLYPTSPFRTPDLIRRVVAGLEEAMNVATVVVERLDLRRFVDVSGDRVTPLVPDGGSGETLRPAGVMMATRYIPRHGRGLANLSHFRGSISAPKVMQRFVPLEHPLSAVDIDTEEDLALAEEILRRGLFDFELEEHACHADRRA